jgi:hypothetical protein
MTEAIAKICWCVVNKLSKEALTFVIDLAIENENRKKNFNQSKLSATMFLNASTQIQCEAVHELAKKYNSFSILFLYFFSRYLFFFISFLCFSRTLLVLSNQILS